MCLIAIAHRANAHFPLVIAANRDEDYDRPTHDAHFWSDAPGVLGGRDALAHGSWLAIARNGRFAAVTNLAGAERKRRSRGALVQEFVTGTMSPQKFAESVSANADEYAAFHFFAGERGGDAIYLTPQSHTILEPGVHAVSNAPLGERWPKEEHAIEEMKVALDMNDGPSMMLVLMQFLALPRGGTDPRHEVLIKGDRYGTRASTVIVMTQDEILFGEQSFARGGVPYSKNRLFRLDFDTE